MYRVLRGEMVKADISIRDLALKSELLREAFATRLTV